MPTYPPPVSSFATYRWPGASNHQQHFEIGGLLGGLFSDSAVAGDVVFGNGVNWPNPAAHR